MRYTNYRIHGDNIVECKRALEMIAQALSHGDGGLIGPLGSPLCPTYELKTDSGVSIEITLFPGFGRWNVNIFDEISNRGGALREAADAVVTTVVDAMERPLFAIEYCGALPAGNQAWQRSGRAYSFGQAGIPYLYVAELGGFELDADRRRIAPRMPNPAVPYSYVCYTRKNGTPTLPVFVPSPGADQASRAMYSDVFAGEELAMWLRDVLDGRDASSATETLLAKSLKFVALRAADMRVGATLSAHTWDKAYSDLHKKGGLVDYLADNARISWSKKKAGKVAITPAVTDLMAAASELGFGLGSCDLPINVIPSERRRAFAARIKRLYGNKLSPQYYAWLEQEKHLVICWVMGFKPRGDDARPDRGLAPLARMLIGTDNDLLSVVYGPAPSSAWKRLATAPLALKHENGLWEAVLHASDAVLGDSTTAGGETHGYLKSHWSRKSARTVAASAVVTHPPRRLGENDVDTVTHFLFSHYLGAQVFEGMCNPPGGDWSGLSLHSMCRQFEMRWLTLPRVSADGSKRPDHVFQIYGNATTPILLAIESKEVASAVEPEIGPRLTGYIAALLKTPACVQRAAGAVGAVSGTWEHNTRALSINDFQMASAVAFMDDTPSNIEAVRQRANVDLMLVFAFEGGGERCLIKLYPITPLGRTIASIVNTANLRNSRLTLSVEAG